MTDFASVDGVGFGPAWPAVFRHWKLIAAGTVLGAAIGLGLTAVIPPIYTARAVLMPPQQQNSASAALSSLGSLAGLAGIGGLKSTSDQYVALMQSETVTDRIIDQFKLMSVYEEDYRVDARKKVATRVTLAVGKKDGLITIEVDDRDAQRAAEMANAYVDELRRMTSVLVVGEAQQRRVFFEKKLQATRNQLTEAQIALQAGGFGAGTLRAEPKSAAEGYARLKAEVTSADIRLQAMRRTLTDRAPEIQQQQTLLSGLQSELARQERSEVGRTDDGYIGRYREYKYQETLFDLYAKQYELARVDESREGTLIQVVDVAKTPDKRSRPKRSLFAGGGAALGFFLLTVYLRFFRARSPHV